jgi:hypothetical protein
MRTNLRAIVLGLGALAATVCITGCNRSSDRSWGWNNWDINRPSLAAENLSETGVTGSSASPYTSGKPMDHSNYYYAPGTRYEYRDYPATSPGVVQDKNMNECHDK